MSIHQLLFDIDRVIKDISDNFELYSSIKNLLQAYNSENIIIQCNEYIEKNNSKKEKIIVHKVFYEKIYLSENKNYSVILIKWNHNSVSRIHDHPDKGCIFKLLKGKLIENCFDNNIDFLSNSILKKDDINYRIGNKILHQIIALDESISLHVYIPGNYTPNYI